MHCTYLHVHALNGQKRRTAAYQEESGRHLQNEKGYRWKRLEPGTLYKKNMCTVHNVHLYIHDSWDCSQRCGHTFACVHVCMLIHMCVHYVRVPLSFGRTYAALETLTEPHQVVATLQCVATVSRVLMSGGKGRSVFQ